MAGLNPDTEEIQLFGTDDLILGRDFDYGLILKFSRIDHTHNPDLWDYFPPVNH